MQTPRRDLLKLAGGGIAASMMSANPLQAADSPQSWGIASRRQRISGAQVWCGWRWNHDRYAGDQ